MDCQDKVNEDDCLNPKTITCYHLSWTYLLEEFGLHLIRPFFRPQLLIKHDKTVQEIYEDMNKKKDEYLELKEC